MCGELRTAYAASQAFAWQFTTTVGWELTPRSDVVHRKPRVLRSFHNKWIRTYCFFLCVDANYFVMVTMDIATEPCGAVADRNGRVLSGGLPRDKVAA